MLKNLPVFIVCILFGACSNPSVVQIGSSLAPFREVLSDSAESALVFDRFSWGQSDAKEVFWVEEPGRTPITISLEPLGLLDVAHTSDGLIYVATEEGLRVADRELLGTPLNDLVPAGEVSSLNAWSDTLWLEGEEETLLVRDGIAVSLAIQDQTLSGPVLEGDVAGEAWVFADGLKRIRWKGAELDVLEASPTPWARWGARSAENTIWAARGTEISVRRDQKWERFLLPESVRGVYSHPESDIIWIRNESEWVVWQGESVRPVEGLASDAVIWGIDASGRILTTVDGRLERWGANYTAQVKGLEADHQLSVESAVQVIPSFPLEVASIEMWVNGESVEGEVSLVPTQLGDGAHEFRAAVTYVDDQTVDVFVPFTVGEFGNPSWKDDILPVFKAQCAICHDGDSESVLNTVESWREDIDEIVLRVSTGDMPLDRAPLQPEELALIRAWRASGMLP